ncbi:RNase HII [Actinopolymorpha cephalotaxi]|uniref:Ribonuclease HII n=1 Tax=Actinopolymorpha cephalotaxi TaxID=504797 RepID=A0A1I2RNB9_9ACTN|nr:ribonuclease HII [Actinopolymorpha cephalotaxi]SFG39266.1 RNase HII [Actinopolymorpha cephalotaxi]
MPAVRRVVVRRDSGLYAYERALVRGGLTPVAGVDEAGRGACAGPLVSAAVILPEGSRGEIRGLADSKLLTAAARERCYAEIVRRAVAWSVVVVPPAECDRLGMHRVNIEALRRALFALDTRPAYVLTDGFPVDGLGAPGLAVWKGDRVIACIAAASVIAKVTRDRLMCELAEHYPAYDFATHKGYCTADHQAALDRYGPCPEHRLRYINVRRAAGAARSGPVPASPDEWEAGDETDGSAPAGSVPGGSSVMGQNGAGTASVPGGDRPADDQPTDCEDLVSVTTGNRARGGERAR